MYQFMIKKKTLDDTTQHVTLCHYLFNRNKIKINQKQFVEKLSKTHD